MKTQAWGWLTAAVLAAGLNASYHDGGMQWAHRIADRVEHNSNAVLALATGHADEFVTEARVLSPRAQRGRVRSQLRGNPGEFEEHILVVGRRLRSPGRRFRIANRPN